MKKILYTFLGFLFFFANKVLAGDVPRDLIPDIDLPGGDIKAEKVVSKIGGDLIAEFIKYVAVVAVIALMLSGIMYLVSGGEEEKTKKAKEWIIWSLVGVFLSVAAYAIVGFINNISVN